MSRLAIIGAGYSGTSLAVNLHRQARRPIHITLFEKRRAHGLGAAYGTPDADHLLNVPAGGMSAFDDAPDHFVDYLRREPGAELFLETGTPISKQYVPRMVYGQYLRSLLLDALRPSSAGAVIEAVQDEVVGLEPREDGVLIRTAAGHVDFADKVVLATGNALPSSRLVDWFRIRNALPDPWDHKAVARIAPDAAVLILGTGLTMVDTAITLENQGHRGPIIALSRRGLSPHPHRPFAEDHALEPLPDGFRELRRHIRRASVAAIDAGGDWRGVVQALRFRTQQCWLSLTTEEQKTFLRHLAPYWETHRHRIAPRVGARIEAMRATGQLRIIGGRVMVVDAGAATNEADTPRESVTVTIAHRGGGETTRLAIQAVINCTGPDGNVGRSVNPLVRDLLAKGFIRPDIHGLGFDSDESGALLGCNGIASPRLFTLGPPTRGRWYEIVAVPDIRRQSRRLAETLLRTVAES